MKTKLVLMVVGLVAVQACKDNSPSYRWNRNKLLGRWGIVRMYNERITNIDTLTKGPIAEMSCSMIFNSDSSMADDCRDNINQMRYTIDTSDWTVKWGKGNLSEAFQITYLDDNYLLLVQDGKEFTTYFYKKIK